MAGMLPGVESARRRRIHQSGAGDSDNRRSSFYLFTPKISHEIHHTSISTPRNVLNQQNLSHQDEKLDRVAREAKERLDERLKRRNSKPPKREILKCMHMDGRSMGLQTEILGQGNVKRSTSKIFGRKISDSDKEECAICLDTFKAGDSLVNLPCAHRFHSNCLIPWLETNAHCPFCRMEIFSSS